MYKVLFGYLEQTFFKFLCFDEKLSKERNFHG